MAPGGTVNWGSTDSWQRLVAAICATGVKINLKATAEMYGTTYDTLENRFRKIKKEGEVLKREFESGERGEVTSKSVPTTPRKAKTPKKDALGSVTNGRITKSTPTKKKNAVKQEATDSNVSSFPGDMPDFEADAFPHGFGGQDAVVDGVFDDNMSFEFS